jgi:transcriptional regulator with XRE-family HTH domain
MIDLKQFRKANNLGQSEVAEFLGVTVPSISAYETGRSKLPKKFIELLQNNGRGWVVPDSTDAGGPAAVYGKTAQNWPEIVADLAAKVGEQNAQIGRLLTIVEQLTAQKK